jgi:hypothetical protein
MRMMLKFSLPVEKGNQAFKDGSLGKVMETIMTKLKLEAAYFGPTDGKRGGMLFFDLAESSQIIEVVEPFFINYNAEVQIVPAMTGDDLRKGFGESRREVTAAGQRVAASTRSISASASAFAAAVMSEDWKPLRTVATISSRVSASASATAQ